MYALRIGSSSGGWTEFPLMAPAARPELLKISPNGCLKEDERYQLRLVTDSSDALSDISVIVDGEKVADGLAGECVSYRDDSGTTLYVYTPKLVRSSGAEGQILLLIYGFARIEVELSFANSSVVILESDDIPVLVRSDLESETARVEGMFDALFSAPPTKPLQWMLTGTPSYDERFSIVEGGTTSPASRSVSTFLQVTAQILSEFERLLPSFRSHARSSISEVPARVPGSKVRVAGAREAHWIATHPHLLQRARAESGIKLGGGFYMPRYVETGQRARSFDTYENRTIVSFLSACGQRLGRLSSLIDSERGVSESVEKALNPFSADGYVLSSLLIASSSHRRGEATRGRAESLRRKASALEHAYMLAVPGVEPGRFLPPRRSKVFQEVVPYTKLYELMIRWCTMGDLDIRGSMLALRTARMDRFYEYYVLLSILTELEKRGFAPAASEESPIGVVGYSLAQTSRFFRNEEQVANRFVLAAEGCTVTLYYQPVIYGDNREENGIRLHRTTLGDNGFDSYYTPDFLLVISGAAGARTVAIDAKYRHTRAVMEDRPDGEFMKCLRKYRQEVSGINGSPAVWLLCGRDTQVETLFWERSSWAQSAEGFIRSGATSLTPMGSGLGELLDIIGIRRPMDKDTVPIAWQSNQADDYAPAFETIIEEPLEGNVGLPEDSVQPAEPEIALGSESVTVSAQIASPAENRSENQAETAVSKQALGSSEIDDKRASDLETASSDSETAVRPKPSSKGGKKSRKESPSRAEGLVVQISELLGQESQLLFDDWWSRTNIGLGRPVLRRSAPTGKEASRYVPLTLNGEELFLARDWTPLNINKAMLLIKRLSK